MVRALPRTIAIALLVAAAGVAAWLLAGDHGAPRLAPPGSAEAAREPEAGAPDAVAADATSLAPLEAQRDRVDPATGEVAALLPVAAAELPFAAAPARGVELRLIDAALQPVADAEIVWLPQRNGATASYATLADTVALKGAGAQRFRGDAQGRCVVPRSLDRLLLFAFAPCGRAAAWIEPTLFFPVELVLRPRFSVVVAVVDAAGAPVAGAEVGWRGADNAGNSAFGLKPQLRATCGADGCARFDELDFELLPPRAPRRSDDRSQRETSQETWVVTLTGVAGAASGASQSLPLPPEPTPDGAPTRVTLRQPAGGALAIVVAGVDGETLTGGSISLRARGPERERLDTWLSLDGTGRLRIEPCELGWSGTVTARAVGRVETRLDFTGPVQAGETVELRLALAPAPDLVCGRAVDSDGRPLAEREITTSPRSGVNGGRTDADGRFALDAGRMGRERQNRDQGRDPGRGRPNRDAPPPPDGPAPVLLTIATGEPPHLPDATEPGRDALLLLRPLDGSTLELGDVPFEARPLVCSGRVVDETGAPVADAVIWATGQPDARWSTREGDPEERARGFARSDADGRFTLFARFTGATCDVAAARTGLIVSANATVALGASDVVLTLSHGGGCEASLRADGPLKPGWFTTAMVAADDGKTAWENPDGEGRLRYALLPARPHDFVLYFTNDRNRELGRIAGVAIAPDTLTLDPRLQRIDPAAFIAVTEVRALLPDGAPLAKGDLFVGVEQRRLRGREALTNGVAFVPFFGEESIVSLRAPGWRVASSKQRPGRIDFALEAPLQIAVTVQGIRPRDDGLEPGRLIATPQSRTLRPLELQAQGSLVDGVASLELPDYGKWDLTLRLMRRNARGEWENAPRGTRDVGCGEIELTPEGTRQFKVKARS